MKSKQRTVISPPFAENFGKGQATLVLLTIVLIILSTKYFLGRLILGIIYQDVHILSPKVLKQHLLNRYIHKEKLIRVPSIKLKILLKQPLYTIMKFYRNFP